MAMKDINFLPNWFMAGQADKQSRRRQCIAIIGLFIVLTVWSFVTGSGLATAHARLKTLRDAGQNRTQAAIQYEQASAKLAELKKQQKLLQLAEGRIVPSAILAELSRLISQRIVISEMSVEPEVYTGNAKIETKRRAKTVSAGKQEQQYFRYRLKITGLAAEPALVAQLLRNLENSEYFCQVVPKFSLGRSINGIDATEFEINCYLANYIEKQTKDK